MDKTPTFKAESKYFKNTNHAENEDYLNNSISKTFESESPGYLPCTQEGFENIDVTWDWNSPQSKKKPKKSQKRLALNIPQSPKKTLKRHISSNSIQGFEKIHEELRLLKEEIAIPEHEESLVLSPIEEAEYKNVNTNNSLNNIELENFLNETQDFFNDSFDEQLLVCTTQMESQLNEVTARHLDCDNEQNDLNNKQVDKNWKHNPLNVPSSNTKMNYQHNPVNVPSSNTKMNYQDNLNLTETTIHFEETYQNSKINNLKIKDKILDKGVPTFGKVEFHRTQSFEISNENLGGIPLSKKEEIERKRQEALAKLESKKKQGNFESPGQCSSEEIERKRQEALAKREARRQQEIIERNRQNALKRLEITRRKNALTVKSSLSSRLS